MANSNSPLPLPLDVIGWLPGTLKNAQRAASRMPPIFLPRSSGALASDHTRVTTSEHSVPSTTSNDTPSYLNPPSLHTQQQAWGIHTLPISPLKVRSQGSSTWRWGMINDPEPEVCLPLLFLNRVSLTIIIYQTQPIVHAKRIHADAIFTSRPPPLAIDCHVTAPTSRALDALVPWRRVT